MTTFSLNRRALLATGLASVALSACSGLIGPPDPGPLYLLKPVPPAPGGGPRVPWQLSVVLPEAADSLDTSRIALVQPNNQWDYYANSSWQDRMPFLVQSALIDAFEASGRIPAVGRDTEGLKSDYLLETDVRDFEAVYAQQDGVPTATVRIAAKLIAAHGRIITQSLIAHSEVAAAANSVPAVVMAFNQALGATLSQIVDWTLGAPIPART
ncbi:MAG: ABC-type transport auxiliary lipoprotein family protein [Rhizomicrobium sp.]